MGKNPKLYRVFLFLLACSGSAGCQALGSSSISGSSKIDPLQEEIAQPLKSKINQGRKDPEVVLKEIPIGTPVGQARAVMEGHGFKCSEGSKEGSSYLLCHASLRTGLMTGTGIDVKIFHQASRVTGAEVVTYYDGP